MGIILKTSEKMYCFWFWFILTDSHSCFLVLSQWANKARTSCCILVTHSCLNRMITQGKAFFQGVAIRFRIFLIQSLPQRQRLGHPRKEAPLHELLPWRFFVGLRPEHHHFLTTISFQYQRSELCWNHFEVPSTSIFSFEFHDNLELLCWTEKLKVH